MDETRLVVCINERPGLRQKSCATRGSLELIHIIRQRLLDAGLGYQVIEQVCLGRCEEGVTMRIAPGGPFFTQVKEQDIDTIIDALKSF